MNVGEDKGRIVTDLIAEVKPQTMVECGGYVGYSAVLFGEAVRRAGGKRYWCLERNPEFAAVTSSMVDLAGLTDVVKVLVGSSGKSIVRLHQECNLKRIDMMFLDHYKPGYTNDLMLSEELKLITPGSVIAADNVIKPGNPPYLEYVRSTCEEKRKKQKHETVNGVDTRFEKWTISQYNKSDPQDELDNTRVGDPNLVYESKMIHSWEPSGLPVSAFDECSQVMQPLMNIQDAVEITRCVGKE